MEHVGGKETIVRQASNNGINSARSDLLPLEPRIYKESAVDLFSRISM